MGFGFFKKAKKENPISETREQLLQKNEGIPFSSEIPDNKKGANLAYKYTDVKCTIIGNITGMQAGSVLYARYGGVLANAAKENVAQIENKKLQDMINDFFDKERFCSVSARLVSITNDGLYCNLGFYQDANA